MKVVRAARQVLADDQQAGAFFFGLALGALLGYGLVVPARPARRLQPSQPPSAPPEPPKVAEPPAAGPSVGVVWRERSDTFRPTVQSEATLPADALWWVAPRDLQVIIVWEAWREIHRHVRSDTSREQIGLLMGTVFRDTGGAYRTLVTQALPLPSSDASPVHVALTHESTGRIAEALRRLPSESTVVGWYHSHPNLGVFLSGTDLRTQRACFAQDWHVAVVVDPVRRESGVFTGASGMPARRRVEGLERA